MPASCWGQVELTPFPNQLFRVPPHTMTELSQLVFQWLALDRVSIWTCMKSVNSPDYICRTRLLAQRSRIYGTLAMWRSLKIGWGSLFFTFVFCVSSTKWRKRIQFGTAGKIHQRCQSACRSTTELRFTRQNGSRMGADERWKFLKAWPSTNQILTIRKDLIIIQASQVYPVPQDAVDHKNVTSQSREWPHMWSNNCQMPFPGVWS